jgi:hypothetical protein
MNRGRKILAGRYLRVLGTLEVLVAEGQIEDARRLLDGIDREEARSLAAEIESGRSKSGGEGGNRRLRLLSPPGITHRKVW